jgi:hypothetical protein
VPSGCRGPRGAAGFPGAAGAAGMFLGRAWAGRAASSGAVRFPLARHRAGRLVHTISMPFEASSRRLRHAEQSNRSYPGLIATGSSLYGFATRLVGVPFGIVIPHIVGSPLETASGWRTWFYVCIGCVVVFVPFIFTMHGPWSPRRARAEYRAHQERVAEELRRLQSV